MEYSTLDIVKKLSIPRERLRVWVTGGYITPSIPAAGQGTKAVFTLEDVYLVALFEELLNRGLKRIQAGYVLASIEEQLPNGVGDAEFLTVQYVTDSSEEKPMVKAYSGTAADIDLLAFTEGGAVGSFSDGKFSLVVQSGKDEFSMIMLINFKRIIKKVNKLLK